MSGLSPLQKHVLRTLAGLQPRWVLFGGAALTGFVLHHRSTTDLDLCFRDRRELGEASRAVQERLEAAALRVEVMQTSPSFRRLRVLHGNASVIVDLVAEPIEPTEAPREPWPGVFVDTPHELLVQKLCALLSRSEVRDLVDVGALLDAGLDLVRAIADAPSKDTGFSPPTLAWVLQSFPLERATALGFHMGALTATRDRLVSALLAQ